MFVNQLINIGNLCPFIYLFLFFFLYFFRVALSLFFFIFFFLYHNYLVDERSFLELREIRVPRIIVLLRLQRAFRRFFDVTKRETQRNDLATSCFPFRFFLHFEREARHLVNLHRRVEFLGTLFPFFLFYFFFPFSSSERRQKNHSS